MVESEDEGGMGGEDEDAGPSKQVSPPPAKKAKRDKDEDEGDGKFVPLSRNWVWEAILGYFGCMTDGFGYFSCYAVRSRGSQGQRLET